MTLSSQKNIKIEIEIVIKPQSSRDCRLCGSRGPGLRLRLRFYTGLVYDGPGVCGARYPVKSRTNLTHNAVYYVIS